MANVLQDPLERPSAILADFDTENPLVTFRPDDVAFTYGSKWKQRYFTRNGDDLFVFPAQWDVRNREWRRYHPKPGADWWADFYPDDQMQRPTGPLCDGCHSVNYDIETKMPTEWNVGCEACHGPGERRLAEQERDHAQHQMDCVEAQFAEAVAKVQSEATLRRSAEIELERVEAVKGDACRLVEQERDRVQHESQRQLGNVEAQLAEVVAKVQKEAMLRRSAEIELERVQGVQADARRLAEQERDRVQHESRHQLDRVKAQLAEAVGKAQSEAVSRRAAEIELERVQQEGSRRVAEMKSRLDRLMADLSKATQETTTTTVKRAPRSRKSKTAPKPAAAAKKTRSATKTVARKPKTAKRSVGPRTTATATKTPAARRR